VLAYNVPYNREVLSGYGYYYKDGKELSRLIGFMEKDFRETGREKILNYYDRILREKYNWDIVISKYESLLQKTSTSDAQNIFFLS
jgi:glycosyltransferase involved in cell wall biosynthesis